MASYAGANQPLSSSGSGPARRLGQFPPVPKSVRVLGVFGHDQPEQGPERLGNADAHASRDTSNWLWALAFMAIIGLISAAIFGARLGDYLGN
jgi:hypothetical protein